MEERLKRGLLEKRFKEKEAAFIEKLKEKYSVKIYVDDNLKKSKG
jgi:hypothetical protein